MHRTIYESQQLSNCYSHMECGVFYDCYVSLNLNSQLRETLIFIPNFWGDLINVNFTMRYPLPFEQAGEI